MESSTRSRAQSRKARAQTCLAVVALLALSSGCTATSHVKAKPSALLTSDQLRTQASALIQKMECAETFELFADASFFDPARGFDCIRADRSAAFVRVYSHRETVQRVLNEWSPTFGRGRQYVRGRHWIVFGQADALRDVARVTGATVPSTRVPSRIATPPRDADRDVCMSTLASAAADRVVAPARFRQQRSSLDVAVPNASRVVEELVTPTIVNELKDKPDYQISSGLSRFGDRFRELCRRALP